MSHYPSAGAASTVVTIPIYRPELTQGEVSLVRTTISVSRNPVFVAPADLPMAFYAENFPAIPAIPADPVHFKSVRHYSEWLTTPSFYDLWKDFSWLIICQTDAVLTADPWTRVKEIPNWDFVGAPWDPPIKVLTIGKRILVRSPSGEDRGRSWVGMIGRNLRVGNGGLSMRRIDTFRRAALEMSTFLSPATRHYIHEDVLWAAFGPTFGVRCAPEKAARSLFHELVSAPEKHLCRPLPDVAGFHGVRSWPLRAHGGGPV